MKKIISLFTTLCIVFGVIGTSTVFAGYTEETMEISTLEDLEKFRDRVNSGEISWMIGTLTADVDMSEKYGEGKEMWTSIGTSENPFSGIFDGNGHIIDISIVSETGGLFGYTTVSSHIKHLNTVGSMTVNGTIYLTPSSSSKFRHIGVIAGYNIGSIENCFNSADINYTGNYAKVGGIAGTAVNGIRNCCNIGKITIMDTYKGNNIACTERVDLMKNCFYLSEEEEQDEYGAQGKTAEQFASGEITYLLNDRRSDKDWVSWYQNIGSDAFPVLDNTHSIVYMKYYNDKPVPSNNDITYHIGRVQTQKDFLPEDNLKLDYAIVNSNEELASVWKEEASFNDIYGAEFFESHSLLIISWQERQLARTHKISDVVLSDTQTDVTLAGCMPETELSPDVITDYSAFIEISKIHADTKVKITVDEKRQYPYKITGLRLTDAGGNEIIVPEQGKSFIVEADIIKTEERNEKDYFFVVVYDESGMLMNLDYVKAKFAVDGECSFGFSIPAQDKSIGSVKAFVWNTFNSMEPLAEGKILAPVIFE